jgi:hypothetical protein
MRIPDSAERISFRSANSKRPAQIEPAMDFGDGFSPRHHRFGGGDERYTLALAGRLKMEVESRQDQPAQAGFEYSKAQEPGRTTYTGIVCHGSECRASVAQFQEDSGSVQVSEYRWNLAP